MTRSNFRTIDALRSVNAVDLTERDIKKFDRCTVRCHFCGGAESSQLWQVLMSSLRLHGFPWRCEACYSEWASKERPRKEVAPKSRTQEELEQLGLVDTTARPILQNERVLAVCTTHPTDPKPTKEVIYNNLVGSFRRCGVAWRCPECVKAKLSVVASSKTGDKNPFYGKTHTETTKTKIVKGYTKWAHGTLEGLIHREYTAERQRVRLSQPELNPMNNPEARANWEASWSEWFHNEERFSSKSKGEIAFGEWLTSLGVQWRTIRPRNDEDARVEFDFYIEDAKLLIEYNGMWTHSEEAGKGQFYHAAKAKVAEKRGERLIMIWEDQIQTRSTQVQDFVSSALGLCTQRVFARECEVIWIGSRLPWIDAFLDDSHIQGASRHYFAAAVLLHKSQPVAVATFGYHHRKHGDTAVVVLNRFASQRGITVVGGLGKISKFASNMLKVDIISWADLSISQGKAYVAANWKEDARLPPDYFYFDRKTNRRVSKQSRKKAAVNTPAGMTEKEHAMADGLIRCWDCGKIRFTYPYASP